MRPELRKESWNEVSAHPLQGADGFLNWFQGRRHRLPLANIFHRFAVITAWQTF